jgi:hypothetical protein
LRAGATAFAQALDCRTILAHYSDGTEIGGLVVAIDWKRVHPPLVAIGHILGALLIAVIRNGLVLLEFSAYWGTVVTGVVIVAAVAIGGLVKRH